MRIRINRPTTSTRRNVHPLGVTHTVQRHLSLPPAQCHCAVPTSSRGQGSGDQVSRNGVTASVSPLTARGGAITWPVSASSVTVSPTLRSSHPPPLITTRCHRHRRRSTPRHRRPRFWQSFRTTHWQSRINHLRIDGSETSAPLSCTLRRHRAVASAAIMPTLNLDCQPYAGSVRGVD